MTGFGKAETVTPERKITVEVRTLNSKQLDLSVRQPARYRALDPDIRAAATRVLQRGKADISVNVENTGGMAGATIDGGLFKGYYSQLMGIAAENGLDTASDAVAGRVFTSVLRLPEVVSTNADNITEEEAAAVMKTVNEALEHIDQFRIEEGKTLIADILRRVKEIDACIPQVEPYEKERTEAVRKRMLEGIEKVGVAVDSNRLEQEMIFYIEKLDVTEEKVRLSNHCRYFEQVVAEEENPGRKLGFIAQEMGREINTLGSKANHAAIQRIVVGMKDELEKIKEQLLNIL